MEFTSLLFLKTKEKGKEILHLDPWTSISSHGRSLAGLGNRGGAGGRIPAPRVDGGEGDQGDEQEEDERNLGVSSVGARMAGVGGSAESSGRRRRLAAAAAVWWPWATVNGSRSTSGRQGS